ncbi:hypothetical protein BO71DRAFT_62550 [Aspergillus ellipticus CBS 707.79]|uniref:Uncharacterized protein n=1 Tax=Aspergillus ellipticus CBS 707.79 TaxID=1448320 RepID=A0A319EJ12_9EURO|nr:hypothetical protein BO71DRAFT_62550 [Aspergillus ellipticus CBS 707.79]
MSSIAAGVEVAKTVTIAAALGFVPVAIHFHLFDIVARADGPVGAEEVLAFYHGSVEKSRETDVPGPRLVDDAPFAMAGLGFVDMVDDGLYCANAITRHLEATPSSQHGALHFTTEALWASAFLMRKLQAETFKYPFDELQTPTQFAYELIGRSDLANQHTYSIMEAEGRMDSFNHFMVRPTTGQIVGQINIAKESSSKVDHTLRARVQLCPYS